MPDENRKEDDSSGDQSGLCQPDVSLTEIHKGPHQATAASPREKSTGKIESASTLPNALAHSDDDEERRNNCNRHVDKERPTPRKVRHDQCSKEWSGYTRDRPCAGGRA